MKISVTRLAINWTDINMETKTAKGMFIFS